MLKKILSVIGIVVVFIIVFIAKGMGKLVGHALSESASFIAQSYSNSPSKPNIQTIEKELAIIADSTNKTLPMMVDKETRFDKIEASSGLHLNHFYTLYNYSSRDIEPSLIQTNVKPDVKKKLCTTEKIKPYLQLGVTYGYVYRGNDGVEINRFEINKNDCNNSVNVASIVQPPVTTIPAQSALQAQSVGCNGDCTNGYGTFTYTDGGRYVGGWKNEKFDGQGTLTYPDGTKITAEWRNGQPTVSGSTTNQPQPNPQATQQDRAIQKAEAQARKQAKKQARAEALARKQEEIQTQIREQTEIFTSPTRVQSEANSKPLSRREQAEADSRAFSLLQQEADKRQSAELRAWSERQAR